MKKILFLLLISYFILPKDTSAQNVQYLGTKDNTVLVRNVLRSDSAMEFPLTDTSKHPTRPGRLTSYNGLPYWYDGVKWNRLRGDTGALSGQVNADWTATTGVALILHKPTLATVATSGSYTDLTNPPTIPAAQVNVDYNAASGITQILNKPRTVDSVYRVVGKDSIFFIIRRSNGNTFTYSILDSAGGTGGGSGTVSNFTAGVLSPIFSTNVGNPTTAPALTFTLNNAAAHTFLGNPTGANALPAYSAITLGDIPSIPISKTLITNGYGTIVNTVNNTIAVDSSVIGYPKFISVFRSPNTDSVYYVIKTNAATTVTTLGFIDSVRATTKGAASAFNLSYQTGPSSFYTRKVRAGTAITLSADTDSTLAITNGLTAVVNNLQVINSGAARSIQVGTFSTRPTGNTGDFYVVQDSSYRESYKTAGGWIWMTVSPQQLTDSFNIKDTLKIVHIGPITNLYTDVTGKTIFDDGSRAGWGMLITKQTDSSNQYMVDSFAIKALAGFGAGGGAGSVQSQLSIQGDGTSGNKLQLVNDSSAVNGYAYYVINGRKGWYPIANGPVASSTTNGLLSSADYIKLQNKITIINAPGSGDSLQYSSFTTDTLVTKRIINGYGILRVVTQNNITYSVDTTTLKGIFGAGSAAVDSVAVGNLAPLFTTTVATPTTTPIVTYSLSSAGAETVFGRNAGTSGAPTYFVPILASALFQNQGTGTTSLHGNAAGVPRWDVTNLATEVGTTILGPTNGGTGQNTWTLGDIPYSSATNVVSKLSGNTTVTKKVLTQIGNGSVSAAPGWNTLNNADVGLGNVENTQLSTWPGTANITTVGTVTIGTWHGTAVDATHGGTGQTSYTTGDVLTATSSTAVGVTSDVATGNALLSGGIAAVPVYGKVNLSTTVTGNLSVNNLNGGAGASGTTFWAGDGTWKSAGASNASSGNYTPTGTLSVGGGTYVINACTWTLIDKVLTVSGSLSFIANGTGSYNATISIPSGTINTFVDAAGFGAIANGTPGTINYIDATHVQLAGLTTAPNTAHISFFFMFRCLLN